MVQTYMRLGELLVDKGVLTNLQLQIALADQRISNRRLGEILVERGFTQEGEVAKALADQYGYPMESLENFRPDPNALQRLSAEDAFSLRALPLQLNDDCLWVAVSDPIDVYSTDRLTHLASCRVELKIAAESRLAATIRTAYGLDDEVSAKFEGAAKAPDRFRGFTVKQRFDLGTVLQAFDSRLDRLVTLVAIASNNPDEVEHFQIVRAASKSAVSGVASIFDSVTHGGYRWTVLPNLEGESLERVLRLRGARNLAQAAELVAKVAETADSLLRHGARADWVCPSNILTTREGPLLVPFDLAPEHYLPPNPDFDAEDQEGASAYAVGVLLKECLYGIGGAQRRLPTQMEDILATCLADDPAKRYRSPIEIASALRNYNWAAIANPLSQNTNKEREELLGLLEVHEAHDVQPEAEKKPFWYRWFKRGAA